VAVNIYQAVKQAMQDLVAPQIESLRGEIVAVRAEMSGLRAEMQAGHAALSSVIDRNHAVLSAEIRRIDDKLTLALDLRERIVALETKVGTGPARA
jgi:hypothetical protein